MYDIISHSDALRHSVLSGDKVLAPWQPEGEKYAPGVVIEGQERRGAQGGYKSSYGFLVWSLDANKGAYTRFPRKNIPPFSRMFH